MEKERLWWDMRVLEMGVSRGGCMINGERRWDPWCGVNVCEAVASVIFSDIYYDSLYGPCFSRSGWCSLRFPAFHMLFS